MTWKYLGSNANENFCITVVFAVGWRNLEDYIKTVRIYFQFVNGWCFYFPTSACKENLYTPNSHARTRLGSTQKTPVDLSSWAQRRIWNVEFKMIENKMTFHDWQMPARNFITITLTQALNWEVPWIILLSEAKDRELWLSWKWLFTKPHCNY